MGSVKVRCGSARLLHFAAARLRSSATEDRQAGHDHLVSVSLFDYQPQHCPFGHQLWPGMAQVGWKPCICIPAQEANERGRGMGHLWVSCNACHRQLLTA
jgi:hypothetical protein